MYKYVTFKSPSLAMSLDSLMEVKDSGDYFSLQTFWIVR